MTWSAGPDDLQAFEAHKQRSMVYTPERRALRGRLQELGDSLGADWKTTDDAPSLANGRRVQEMWLFSIRPSDAYDRLGGPKVHLSSPFALDTLPFHDHMARFVRVDSEGYSWGLLLHAKAKADRANLEVLLKGHALHALIDGLDAEFSLDAEAPLAAGDDSLGDRLGKGFCLWWRRPLNECTLEIIQANLNQLDPLCDALGWHPDRDLAGLVEKAKKEAIEASATPTFSPGDRVRIRKGLLTGRRGQVDGIRADGRIMVALGPAAMDFSAEDLFKEG